jgi:hypothetical protein
MLSALPDMLSARPNMVSAHSGRYLHTLSCYLRTLILSLRTLTCSLRTLTCSLRTLTRSLRTLTCSLRTLTCSLRALTCCSRNPADCSCFQQSIAKARFYAVVNHITVDISAGGGGPDRISALGNHRVEDCALKVSFFLRQALHSYSTRRNHQVTDCNALPLVIKATLHILGAHDPGRYLT